MTVAVVSDDLLNAILSDKAARQALPCTAMAPMPAKGCNCNKAGRHTFTPAELESVKICLTRLPPEKLIQLKQYWKVDRIIVHLKTPGLPARVAL